MSLEEILEFLESEGNTNIVLCYNEEIDYEINDKSKRIKIFMQDAEDGMFKVLISSIDELKYFNREKKAISVSNLPPEEEMYKNMGYYVIDGGEEDKEKGKVKRKVNFGNTDRVNEER